MTTQHTPGPWGFCDNGEEITVDCGDIYGAVIMPAFGDCYPHDEQLANARLISAAPELLAAFDCVPIPPDDFDTDEGCRAYADAIIHWLDTQCAAAIAKARGE